MHPIWNLFIYAQDGSPVASASRAPNAPLHFQGDMIALAEALPSIAKLARFVTDPDEQARAAYSAYASAMTHAGYSHNLPTWDHLVSDPIYAATLAVWRRVAQAAASVDPTLN